jgi:cytochrome b561
MTVQGYSWGQIALHWIVAALVGLQFLFQDGIGAAFRQGMRAGEPFVLDTASMIHLVSGVLVLAFILLRLTLRGIRGAPRPHEDEPAWQKLAAAVSHWSLYGILVVIPASGLFAWYGASRGAASVHEVLTSVLIALIGLHVAAALFGQFVQKSGVLVRMLTPGR